MTRTRTRRTGSLAALTLVVSGLGVAGTTTSATAGGAIDRARGGGGERGYGVTIPMTQRASTLLRRGENQVRPMGRADVDTDEGRLLVSFPVAGFGDRDGRDHDRGRPGGGGDDRGGDDVAKLDGGIAFVGDGPRVWWSKLRVNLDRGRITAIVNGQRRVTVMRVVGDRDDRYDRAVGSGGGSPEAVLRLTRPGAVSLNRAAAGSPFRAGSVITRESTGCR